MYTQCPKCKVVFTIAQDQLEHRDGVVRCGTCMTIFDASLSLSEDVPVIATATDTESVSSEESSPELKITEPAANDPEIDPEDIIREVEQGLAEMHPATDGLDPESEGDLAHAADAAEDPFISETRDALYANIDAGDDADARQDDAVESIAEPADSAADDQPAAPYSVAGYVDQAPAGASTFALDVDDDENDSIDGFEVDELDEDELRAALAEVHDEPAEAAPLVDGALEPATESAPSVAPIEQVSESAATEAIGLEPIGAALPIDAIALEPATQSADDGDSASVDIDAIEFDLVDAAARTAALTTESPVPDTATASGADGSQTVAATDLETLTDTGVEIAAADMEFTLEDAADGGADMLADAAETASLTLDTDIAEAADNAVAALVASDGAVATERGAAAEPPLEIDSDTDNAAPTSESLMRSDEPSPAFTTEPSADIGQNNADEAFSEVDSIEPEPLELTEASALDDEDLVFPDDEDFFQKSNDRFDIDAEESADLASEIEFVARLERHGQSSDLEAHLLKLQELEAQLAQGSKANRVNANIDTDMEVIEVESSTTLTDFKVNAHADNMATMSEELVAATGTRWGKAKTAGYTAACLMLVALLGWQARAFYINEIAQSPAMRPLLTVVCNWMSCEVPARVAPQQMSLLATFIDVHPDEPDAIRIATQITNSASFAQPFPNVRLTMTDKHGRVLARRNVTPSDYLPANPPTNDAMINPGETEKVYFDLLNPRQDAFGYEVELVHAD